jgi:hypothetical protein
MHENIFHFAMQVFTTKQYVRGVSTVQGAWLPMAAPKYFGNSKLASATTTA